MKVLNSLSKQAHLMMAVCLALGIVSCSNEVNNFTYSGGKTVGEQDFKNIKVI